MIDLSTAKIGEKFITRNGVVVDYIHKQSQIYGNFPHTYIVTHHMFSWEIAPNKVKFLSVNRFGLEHAPFEGKWDIIKKAVIQTTATISIF